MYRSVLASLIVVTSGCVLGAHGWGWNNNYFNRNKPPANKDYNQNKLKTVTIVNYVTQTQLKTVTYCPPSATVMPLVGVPPANPPSPPANPPSPPANPPSPPANPPSPPANPPSPPANPPSPPANPPSPPADPPYPPANPPSPPANPPSPPANPPPPLPPTADPPTSRPPQSGIFTLEERRCGLYGGQMWGWCPENQECSWIWTGEGYSCGSQTRPCGDGWSGWCSGQQMCNCVLNQQTPPWMQTCTCGPPTPPRMCGKEFHGLCLDPAKPRCLEKILSCSDGYGGGCRTESYCSA